MSELSSRETWLNQLASGGQFERIFEDLPDLLFFAKDLEARNRDCNQAMLNHLGLQTKEQLYGKHDTEFLPYFMAEKYKVDDHTILRTQSPLINLIELFPAENNLPQLYVTNKYPLFDLNNRPCGICGIIRKYNDHSYTDATHSDLVKAVQHISLNYAQKISIQQLADASKLSIRQFQRKFQLILQTTPQEYLLKFRLLKAADQLIQSDHSITQIALETGFYDHSSFTRHFKKYMNKTPRSYRANSQIH
ncbi:MULTISPECIES: helix-turn-helix domain-containing protein [unclassified Lentimonas]|uniref:helix-turn-helix domain-containing protein n=1 Tax=unclassified Lentimonas TaxID=2630993 RepID=UPI001329249F|nr:MULTISPECIES: helix-turn-helix domain-containing protein [unclassified Lentimonas]CAA6692168.1 Unannotated [Lentimonas sp. CC19]CAA6697025.1 Unannotated [Lentimonas sp. CC10]CAA7070588.1 Unannotated [Lentimonas sp. CC11]